MTSLSQDPSWLRALRLLERCPGAESLPHASGPGRDEAVGTLRKWRSETGLEPDDLFGQRLELDGVSAESLLGALSESPAELHRRMPSPPEWLGALERVYRNGADRPADAADPPAPTGRDGGPLGRLSVLLEPILTHARSRLDGRLLRLEESHPEAPFDRTGILDELTRTFTRELRWMAERVVVLELHVRRLQGTLPEGDPGARFESFVSSLADPETALAVLRDYPVLARRAVEGAESWIGASHELLERFARDRQRIAGAFSPDADPGTLTGLATGRGDRHEGGRSVSILVFSNGLKVVYKPRSLAVDRAFQELVRWLDERGADPPLPVLSVIDRGEYGWMEFVLHRTCADETEVERFFERQGAWAALLYALEGSDFHYENVIAVGEDPVLVDLETLFRPRPRDPAPMGPGSDPLRETVLGSGLLPRRQWTHDPSGGLEMSGLGAAPGQTMEVRDLAAEPGDDPRYVLRHAEVPGGSNLPTLGGEPVSPWPWRGAVLRGFDRTYRFLRRERDALLAADGPLAPFRGAEVRVIQRGTAIYARLLSAAIHPDYLQDGLQQDRLFDKLWLDGARFASLRRLIPIEAASLARGEIPRFTSRTDSRALAAPGGERIEGYFAASGWDLVRRRLEGLGDRDLERQRRFLEESLETLRPLAQRRTWPSEPLPAADEPAPRGRLFEAARGIAERLASRAVAHRDGHVSWLHIEVTGKSSWSLAPVGVDLYDGLFGIALFLSHLEAETPGGARDGELAELARRAVATARTRIRHNDAALRRIGAFDGWGGAAYACCRLGALWAEPDLLDRAEDYARRGLARLDEDRSFDVIGGAAGLAAALLALHRVRPAPWLLEAAARCGDHLLAHGREGRGGLAWPPPPGVGTEPLTGFGHGAAGAAWSLAHLGDATGERRFADAARRALAYERCLFSPEQRNWPDLRDDRRGDGGPPFLHAWCHGAPGIGLGRLGTAEVLDDPEIEDEVRAAVASTLEEGFGRNHCLCHGDLGNLELVTEAARRLDDLGLRRTAEGLAARVLTSVEAGPRCGGSAGHEAPGLMSGLAGIGYGLLRLAAPERVPSVLLLEAPSPG